MYNSHIKEVVPILYDCSFEGVSLTIPDTVNGVTFDRKLSLIQHTHKACLNANKT